VIRYEIGLHRQERMPVTLVAATLIMANRQIDKATFQELWEEMKTLNILRFAHEMGVEEGRERTGEWKPPVRWSWKSSESRWALFFPRRLPTR